MCTVVFLHRVQESGVEYDRRFSLLASFVLKRAVLASKADGATTIITGSTEYINIYIQGCPSRLLPSQRRHINPL